MLIKILLVLIIFVAAFLLVASFKPDTFNVSRSLKMNAPASVVFHNINDLNMWQAWSPWVKMDPQAKGSFEGPTSGTGAVFSWDGKKTGQGTMTIIESVPYRSVKFKLDFRKPFVATNYADFTLDETNGQTTVTWTMSGKNNFMAKMINVVVNCDKMVGSQFEDGLASIKAIVESK